jgi:hypothetical protein
LNREIELFAQIMLRGLILIKMLPVMDYAAATVPWRQRRRVGRFESKIRALQ